MTRRTGRVAGAAAVICATVTAGVIDASPARADTNLIGWTAQSDANVFDLVVDNSSGLAGAHPLSEIDVPEDLSDYETGPLGHALATMAWPGSVAGNAGSLSGELGLPAQLAPIAGGLNDPVRAEAFYPAGPADATYPPGTSSNGAVEMTSHADSQGSSAKAGLADVVVPGLLDLQSVQGTTSSTTDSSSATSAAAGGFQSLSLLGGIIQIGSTTSSASAQSDGTSPSGTSTSHVGTITVAGQQVSVGSDGVVVGPANTGLSGLLSAVPTALVDQVTSLLHLTIVAFPQTETSQAPAEQITSGGLQISFSLPSDLALSLNCTSVSAQLGQLGALCTVPGLLQGFSYTFTLGRVSAEAIAAPPFAIGIGQTLVGALPGTTVMGSLPGQSGTAANGVPTDLALPSPAPSSASTPPSGTGGAPSPTGLGSAAPVSLSSLLGVGLVVGLLVLAGLVGLGLRRVTGLAGAAGAARCPHEEVP